MILAKDITKTYVSGEIETRVLRGIDLHIKAGEFVAVMGKSGAGKSTLMYQLALLDLPTTGSIEIDGVDVLSISERDRTNIRLQDLGYVFQDYALLPELTAQENVMMPLLMIGMDRYSAQERAREVLDQVELGHRYRNRPSQLSGGEQQRVSIARAIVQKPKILFADELTANLDTASSTNVIELLMELHKAGQTIVMVTHEAEYTYPCDRIIYLEDGKIISHDYDIENKTDRVRT